MKPESVIAGRHEVGPFWIYLHQSLNLKDYFDTFITSDEGDITFYVDPKSLEGFMFLQFNTFERKLTDEDVIEYNHYINVKSCVQPTYLMSRHSLVKLFDVLQAKAKKLNKNKEKRL